MIGTANLRDRGVHEMSSALKRRFNFETVVPLTDPALEMAVDPPGSRQAAGSGRHFRELPGRGH